MLIETILAAFEMDAILYELRDHSCALNAGRWDYIFSCIKKMGAVLPDRAQVTMTVPFMRAYTELLVRTCHARGAHAIGGMAAFIPSRRDPEVNAVALAKVGEDKRREAGDGFDGTWVAHPDLVSVARSGVRRRARRASEPARAHGATTSRRRSTTCSTSTSPAARSPTTDCASTSASACATSTRGCTGVGAAAIDNLMEDAATAEISRAQVWSWVQAGRFDEERVRTEIAAVEASDAGEGGFRRRRPERAVSRSS